MPAIRPMLYKSGKWYIRNGDLLLFRGNCILSHAIRLYDDTDYSHAAKAFWLMCGGSKVDDRLLALETLEDRGAVASSLEKYVKEMPGSIDVYRTNPEELAAYDSGKAAAWMWDQILLGRPYGIRSLLRIALTILPFFRWFFPPNTNNSYRSGVAPICSSFCATADEEGGYDVVPNLAAEFVTPQRLAQSTFYRYMFTLYWDELPGAPPETE